MDTLRKTKGGKYKVWFEDWWKQVGRCEIDVNQFRKLYFDFIDLGHQCSRNPMCSTFNFQYVKENFKGDSGSSGKMSKAAAEWWVSPEYLDLFGHTNYSSGVIRMHGV